MLFVGFGKKLSFLNYSRGPPLKTAWTTPTSVLRVPGNPSTWGKCVGLPGKAGGAPTSEGWEQAVPGLLPGATAMKRVVVVREKKNR